MAASSMDSMPQLLSDSEIDEAPAPKKQKSLLMTKPAAAKTSGGPVKQSRAQKQPVKKPSARKNPSANLGQGETLRSNARAAVAVELVKAPDGRSQCLEVFAGSGNLTAALEKKGLHCDKVDILLCDGHDMSKKQTVKELGAADDSITYKYVHLAPPCNTYSAARYPKIRLGLRHVCCLLGCAVITSVLQLLKHL